jgi:Saxitoxin biosynthesis operon protein SxtJ
MAPIKSSESLGRNESKMQMNFHENLGRSTIRRRSSDRAFGVIMAAFFTLLGLAPLRRGAPVRPLALFVAAVFLALGLLRPGALRPIERVWNGLGLLLGRIFNPVATALLFYLVFTPTGWMLRWLGRDALRLRRSSGTDTYWIRRNPPGPKPETMSKQF